MLGQTVLLFFVVAALAVITLRLAARHGIGTTPSTGKKLEVLERLPLGRRQQLLAVRVAGKVLVLSQADSGLRNVGELGFDEWTGGFASHLGGGDSGSEQVPPPRGSSDDNLATENDEADDSIITTERQTGRRAAPVEEMVA